MQSPSFLDQVLALGPVDLAGLVILAVFLVRGLIHGLVWQVAGLFALFGGLVAARTLAPQLAPQLRRAFSGLSEESGLDLIAAYFVILLVVASLVALLARWMKGLIDQLHLTAVDRFFGGIFGLLKAAVLVILLVSLLAVVLPARWNAPIANAYTGRWSEAVVQKSGPLVPEEVKQHVRETLGTLRRTLTGPEPPAAEGAPAEAIEERPTAAPADGAGPGSGGRDPY